jgi:hypothetical protein
LPFRATSHARNGKPGIVLTVSFVYVELARAIVPKKGRSV